ncbi:RNA polymerase sigma factor [Clostridium swellfunianum]|uniref:RNA polymerase sigma factor n=1 Tax=Clostridium swellfunianum TaxID=1367462 RepID=UPI00202FFBBA|nr:RNA polymerase sigma factor [Clostridium swellfunianum]MCM0649142.1 RNA polymerase sigma factor [Clostridium swellfunianum]
MDRELLQRIREGDNEAFEELYNKYADYALRVAAVVTKNKMSAADAVQEAFIRVYKNIQAFDLDKPFEPWFYRILINECNRVLGKNSNLVLVDDFIENNIQGSSEDAYNFEEYESLYKAIESLEDNNKIPIVLKYLRGFKESEIADILGININTIKSRLFKGRQKLRTIIERLEENRGDGSYGR